MRKTKGDIFQFHKNYNDSFLCVPTNKGYTSNGYNVMGRGVAYAVKMLYPGVEITYGEVCKKRHLNNDSRNIVIMNIERLIMFPTKKLDTKNPHLSWKQDSDIGTIEQSARELSEFALQDDSLIFIPLVGCGNGKLNRLDVIPILKDCFKENNNIVLVERKNTYEI